MSASIADLVRRLAAAGASPEAIAIAVEAVEAVQMEIASRRAADRDRKARQRERSRDAGVTVTGPSRDNPDLSRDVAGTPPQERKVSPCTPSKETHPSSDADASDARSPQPQAGSVLHLQPAPVSVAPPAPDRSHAEAFARFWQVYPHKVGKQDAEKAFNSVMKRGAVTLDRMLAALDRYMRTKPPDRPWCNPATWLRQGRWDDEPGPDPIQRGPFPPPPPSPSRSSVGLSAVADWVLESTGGGAPPQASGGFRSDGGAEGYGGGDVLPLGPAPRPRFAG
ncbi:hypothetical protein GGQ86_002991 [Xanthobacter flavus]|uniref:Uncharacterized protein n=1 Tax=Xanthobacter flavus TaxID=281 RepID=A0ABU1KI52_XANFL|nr:hypothetical protein [Xanthobacter flavus]